MVEKQYLKQALIDLGYRFEEGSVEIRGYGGKRTAVEIKIPTRNPGYDLGFQKSGEGYELVADWWGIKDVNRDQFLQQVTQRYAYNAARAKLEEQGFSLAGEERLPDGRIHMVLRRLA